MTTDLARASASDLSALFAARKASPVEALNAVLARVEAVNPDLNALTLVDAGPALEAARASEARWAAGAPLSPLDGAPVSIKELVRTRGWPQTMASRLADKTPATEDAPAVARLREGGAVVFAQSTSPEYGFKGVTDSPLNGVTRNPWNRDLTPGGSSGGAGAAVAASMGPLAIGTDGGGSVRLPAAFTGLVGLKATYGRIPAWPPSMHGDLANTGPMTRTVRDCAMMLNLISKPDARESFAAAPDDTDYVARLDQPVAGLKVGFLPRAGDYYVDPEIAEAAAAAARRFEALGCTVEEIAPPFDNAQSGRVWSVHWLSALQRLLQVYPADRHGEFDPGLLDQARTGEKFSVQTLVDAMVTRREIGTAWNAVFTRYDLVIQPTTNMLPFAVGQNLPTGPDGRPNPFWANTAAANLTRHPAISIPCGLSRSGLPIGLQILAAHYRDDLVLAAANAFLSGQELSFPA